MILLSRARLGPAEPVLWGEVAVLRGYAAGAATNRLMLESASDDLLLETGDGLTLET